jgi:hypothetical protein
VKYFLLITFIFPAYVSAMENNLQITNRHLDTLKRPHITIINQLPLNDPEFTNTRIDISDQTKVKTYTHNSYRPDDSTKTIYSNKAMRFSPQTHRNIHEYKRLGMNDTGKNALIAIYLHDLRQYPLMHVVIGEGSDIQFGDVLTFSINDNREIILKSNNKIITSFINPKTKNYDEIALLKSMSEKANYLQAKHIQAKTNTEFSVHLIGLPDNYLNFIEEYPYIKGITMEVLTSQ